MVSFNAAVHYNERCEVMAHVSKHLAFAVLSLIVMFAPPAFSKRPLSENEKASQYLILCKSENPNVNIMCTTYLRGFTDGARMQSVLQGSRGGARFCLEEYNITGRDLRKAFVRYLGDHPSLLNEWVVPAAQAMLEEYYPCRKADIPSK